MEKLLDQDNIFGEKSFFEVYPNPVNELFFIEYFLERKENVTIDFYNGLGQKIGSLIENETQLFGKYFYQIESKEMNENMIFIHWKAGTKSKVQKVVFLGK